MCVVDGGIYYDRYDLLEEVPIFDNQYNEEDMVSLEYDPERQGFIDWTYGGYLVHDIYRLLKPWQVFLFKHYKRNYIFPDVTGKFLVEMYWPVPDGYE